MRAIRALFSILGCLTICVVLIGCKPPAPLAGPSSDSLTKAQAFAPGGQVHLHMNVGDLQVQPSAGDRELRLVIRSKRSMPSTEMQSWVRRFEVSGSDATIRLRLPQHGNLAVTLYIPSLTSLNIDLGVGNVNVDRIRGDRDLTVGVGNLTLRGLDREDYRSVRLSTAVGNLSDRVFSGRQSGMIGKSESATGSGKYHLRVKVGTGNLTLQKGTAGVTD